MTMNLDARVARTIRHFSEVGFIFLPVQFLFAQVRDQCYTVTERRGYKALCRAVLSMIMSEN